jgi:apolipoprotein N-acyltransferase
MEKLQDYFQHNQGNFGYVIIAVALFFIYGAYKDWDWILAPGGGMGTFNLTWIANTFGRKTARVIVYVVGGIAVGLGVFWIMVNNTKK